MVSFFIPVVQVLLFLLAVPFAQATPTPNAGTLVPRQGGFVSLNLTTIPSQCSTQCSGVSKLKDCGVDPKCICTDQNSDSIADCLTCFVMNDNKTLPLTAAQANMDAYTAECTSAGITVKVQKLGVAASGGLVVRPEVIGVLGLVLSGLAILL